MTTIVAVRMMAAVAGLALVLECVEDLSTYSPDGRVTLRRRRDGPKALVSSVLGRLAGPRPYWSVALTGAQAACATVLLAGAASPAVPSSILAAGCLAAASVRLRQYARLPITVNGGDRMLVIVLLSAGLGAALDGSGAGTAFASYAGMQAALAYTIAGGAKLMSESWRRGDALNVITATTQFGLPALHRRLTANVGASRALAYAVIGFECAAPVALVAGPKAALVFVVIGVSFHCANAVVLGLNNFVWAFVAAYPSYLLLAERGMALRSP